MNSHVQLPKFLMKSFSRKTKDGKVVSYLDLKSNMIHEEKIKKLGTIENYYCEETELFLSKEIEGPFSSIASKVRDFEKKKTDSIVLSNIEHESAIKFLNYSFLRSRRTLEETNKSSYTSIIRSITHEDLFALEQLNPNLNFFKDLRVNVLLNFSEFDFVIPQNCFYEVSAKQTPMFVLPFSPRAALTFENEESFKETIVNGDGHYYRVNNNEEVNNMNLRALRIEQLMNNGFIVSKNRKELDEIRESL